MGQAEDGAGGQWQGRRNSEKDADSAEDHREVGALGNGPLFTGQMMDEFYRERWDAMPPVWIFVGLNAASAAALIYVAMVFTIGRGPHDLAAGTLVRARAPRVV